MHIMRERWRASIIRLEREKRYVCNKNGSRKCIIIFRDGIKVGARVEEREGREEDCKVNYMCDITQFLAEQPVLSVADLYQCCQRLTSTSAVRG